MKEIITSLLRHLLTSGGGVLVGKGVIAASTVDETVGAILTIVGVVWSIAEKRSRQPAAPQGDGK
jgi:hypothetical protein